VFKLEFRITLVVNHLRRGTGGRHRTVQTEWEEVLLEQRTYTHHRDVQSQTARGQYEPSVEYDASSAASVHSRQRGLNRRQMWARSWSNLLYTLYTSPAHTEHKQNTAD